MRAYSGRLSQEQELLFDESKEALKDKYDKQLEEALHYQKYLARVTLNLKRRRQAQLRLEQTFARPDIQETIKQAYQKPFLRRPTGEEHYNPLFDTHRQMMLWKPIFHKWRMTEYPDPRYYRQPFMRGPFRPEEDMLKEAHRRWLSRQIRRATPLPPEEPPRKSNRTTPFYPYAFPWEISTKKKRKLSSSKTYRKSSKRYHTRKAYSAHRRIYPRYYLSRV
jgi:hypothetical protein